MSTKHTPGPWAVDGNSAEVVINGADESMVASCFTFAPGAKGSMAHERMMANAHLIAAAPELLELVMLANHGFKGSHTVAWQEKARAAIDKATGKS